MTGRADCRFTALLLVICIRGYAVAGTADDPVAGLSRCAATADRDDRLACYDGLASRYAQPNRKTTAVVPPPASAATPATPASAATLASAAAKVPAMEPKAEFGLTVAQLRKEPDAPVKPQSIDGVVTGFGTSSLGRPVVRLDNTQSWELLDELDPLLSPGDKVTIRRATMGSFLLTTPTKRMHRVRRIS